MDGVKCPYCGLESGFKLLKTWKYSWWNTYFYVMLEV